MRQTVLGIDASGPHLFGARSYADLRVDFDGNPASGSSTTTYSGYYNANTTLLRLRTAHAGLQWEHTEAYFSLDHPIFSPDMPTSLTAVAIPALAWSGNLWTWNPQVGLNQDFGPSDSRGIRLQAALIDVGDAPLSPPAPTSGISTAIPPSSAEESRWPGVEARVELRGPVANNNEDRDHFGIGGYFAPHYSSVLGHGFDSWAGTLDARLLLPARLEFTGSFYRGQALGGLGGGAYKDFAYKADPDSDGYYFRPLDDVGGWAQLKERLSERLELNAAFGIDNAFADELRRYAVPGGTTYQNLSRNRTYTGNVIYSPSAYLTVLAGISASREFSGLRSPGAQQHHRPGGGISILMKKRRFGEWILCAATLAPGILYAQTPPATNSPAELRLRIVSSLPGKHRAVPAVIWLEPLAGTPALSFPPHGHYTLTSEEPHVHSASAGNSCWQRRRVSQ